MLLYDYLCSSCGHGFERLSLVAERNNSKECPECGLPSGERTLMPQPCYKPWEPYFDEGLGVFVTGKQHRRRVMRDLGFDFKDHMSKGDQTARADRAMEARKEAIRRGQRKPHW